MTTPVTVLIDADPLVYRIGFACERARYSIEWRDVNPAHPEDPDWDTVHLAFLDSAWRCEEFCLLKNLAEEEVVRRREIDPEPLSHALRSMRESIENIIESVNKYLEFHDQHAGDVRLFLTGGRQFREKLATIRPYKGNRDRSKRPYWYKELREYLVETWGAEVCEVIEADDAVSLHQWQGDIPGETIICTIDKDLLMVPGHHYDYLKKTAFHVSFEQALLTFYRQLMLGDASDNIPGCYKVGKVAVKELLPIALTEEEMFAVALSTYEENIAKYPEHHAPHENAWDSLVENARLLWMQEAPDSLWQPPGSVPARASVKAFLDSVDEDPDEGVV